MFYQSNENHLVWKNDDRIRKTSCQDENQMWMYQIFLCELVTLDLIGSCPDIDLMLGMYDVQNKYMHTMQWSNKHSGGH